MRDQELILRFFALYFYESSYERPMDSFLNKYMGKNRDLGFQSRDVIETTFAKTIQTVSDSVGSSAFRPKNAFNAAVFDAVMVGIARRLGKGNICDLKNLKRCYESLVGDKAFLDTTEEATSNAEKVHVRLSLSTKAFAGAP